MIIPWYAVCLSVCLTVLYTVEPPNNRRNWDDCFVLLMEVVLCSEAISIKFTTRNKTITSYVGMTMVKKNRQSTKHHDFSFTSLHYISALLFFILVVPT